MAEKVVTVSGDGVDDVRLCELSSMKASYEYLNKAYRGHQRALERDLQTMMKAKEDWRKAEEEGRSREGLGTFLEQVASLKRKAASIVTEELNYTKTCKVRLDHLLNLSTGKNNDLSIIDDKTDSLHLKRLENVDSVTRFQRHLADHLFAKGYCKTAVELSKTITSGENFDEKIGMIEIYKETLDVIQALKSGDFQFVELWLQSIQFKYKKGDVKNTFEVDLQIFKLYLLIKEGQWEKAVKFANSFCDPKTIKDGTMDKLSKVMTLMVYRSYSDLIAAAREWEVDEEWIVKRFHAYVLQFYSFYHDPTVLSLIVNTGIAVLKTEHCYKSETKKKECVICTDRVNKISHNIPSARHDHSILICWKTGLEMNEDNPPISFPNGYVYSSKAIPELIDHSDNKVVCPRSGYRCKESELQKVYIV